MVADGRQDAAGGAGAGLDQDPLPGGRRALVEPAHRARDLLHRTGPRRDRGQHGAAPHVQLVAQPHGHRLSGAGDLHGAGRGVDARHDARKSAWRHGDLVTDGDPAGRDPPAKPAVVRVLGGPRTDHQLHGQAQGAVDLGRRVVEVLQQGEQRRPGIPAGDPLGADRLGAHA